MSKRIIYLAGPMSGIPRFNFPAFDDATRLLRSAGWEVRSPAELDGPDREWIMASPDGILPSDRPWQEFLARDVALVSRKDTHGVVVLPGWEASRGANLEVCVARALGKPVYWYAPNRPERDRVELLDLGDLDHLTLNSSLPLPQDPDDPILDRGEVRVVDPTTGGEKGSKPQRYDLLPWNALDRVAEVYGFGTLKYAAWNWSRGYVWSLSFAAMLRHQAAFWMGEDDDPQSGLPHMAHAVFHALALIYFSEDERFARLDDRPEASE